MAEVLTASRLIGRDVTCYVSYVPGEKPLQSNGSTHVRSETGHQLPTAGREGAHATNTTFAS